jgi:tRNA threonylcarbamoyladenosine biosynthesis protein TsaE
MSTFCTFSDQETMELGKKIGQECKGGETWLLYGDLGAGKTTLSKGIISSICNIEPHEVVSPTFVYLQIYEGEKNTVYHFDLYRLQSEEEFYALGFDEYLSCGGVVCIEWPERVPSLVETLHKKVRINHKIQGQREVNIT